MVIQKQSLVKNLSYQFLYQVLVLVVPLVMTPYLTRTLHGEALGVYQYVNSIVSYFFLFANLGIARHGARLISQKVDNERDLRIAFWSLFVLHAIVAFLCILAYALFVRLFVKDNVDIYYIHILYLISALFDTSWFFIGLECFKKVVIYSSVVKVIETVFIFVFVKEASDLSVYALIINCGFALNSIVLFVNVFGVVKPIRISMKDIVIHIKPMLLFTVSVVAASLYTVFDKTLLGVLASKENVAYYTYSYQIIRVPIVISSVVGSVVFPRACRMVAEGNTKEQKKVFDCSITFITMVSVGAMFGILGVSDLLAEVYLGKEFSVCGNVMKALTPLIYIVSIGEIIRNQYLIPNGLDDKYVKCLIFNAIINVVISSILIPFLGIFGAIIGTMCAELFGLLYQSSCCCSAFSFKEVLVQIIPFSIFGFAMLCIIYCVGFVLPFNFLGLIVEILIGFLVYAVLVILYFVKSKKQNFTEMIRLFTN